MDVSTTALRFAPGETLKTVRIGIVDDSSVEDDESFNSAWRSAVRRTPRSGTSRVIGTIIDNDATAGTPVIRISDPVVDEAATEAMFCRSRWTGRVPRR